jgi:hypothetical protein
MPIANERRRLGVGVTMVPPPYTKAEIADLALNQLADGALDEAVAAFNGFCSMFGRAWIDDYFQGAKIPSFVRSIMEMWRDYRLIHNLPKDELITKRWRGGISEQGVGAELRILAQLCRVGFEIELFPSIKKGRVPDARIRLAREQPWTYVEVSQRAISKVRRDAELTMQRVAERAADSRPGVHSKVAILRQPDMQELQRILDWLTSLPPTSGQFEDLAILWVQPLEVAVDATDQLRKSVPGPCLFTTRIAAGPITKRATVCIGIADMGAERILSEESRQLPQSQPGILILDTSFVLDGIEIWEPLIRRRFQPRLNTRIGAVVLTQWQHGAAGRQSESGVVPNPHAAIPINSSIIEKLEMVFPRKSTSDT